MSTNKKMASPAKLRDGSWGARVRGEAVEGEAVQIETRSGKTWTAIVECVLWTGPDTRTGGTISLCQTRSADSSRRSSPRRKPSSGGWCTCGACDDLMSYAGMADRFGQIIRCPECGGKAEVC